MKINRDRQRQTCVSISPLDRPVAMRRLAFEAVAKNKLKKKKEEEEAEEKGGKKNREKEEEEETSVFSSSDPSSVRSITGDIKPRINI